RTGTSTRSFSRTATSRRTPGTTTRASPFSRGRITSWVARRSSTARRYFACARRTLVNSNTTTGCLRPGLSPMTTCSPTIPMPNAQADVEVICVRPDLKHLHVTLVTQAHVRRLKTSASGREVIEVVVGRNGAAATYRGNTVVVSAGAANSARLLLMSANDQHPRGLANGSDQVGRNYMFHNSTAVVAISRHENPTMFQKTLSLNDLYFGANDFAYPLGNLQMIGKSQGVMFRGDAPRLIPGMTLDQMAKHAVDFWLTTEDLPDPNNRITINAAGAIQLHYTFNNQ